MNYLETELKSKKLAWFNEPQFELQDNFIVMTTSPNTDFWQRTHYGFRRDNGRCLLKKMGADFLVQVKTLFKPAGQYDQCGLIVRIDSENWIKASMEYEGKNHLRLGSVVTNHGYSDWATIDINEPVNEISYRIQSKNNLRDYLIEYSRDAEFWSQLRIAHLHEAKEDVQVGIYACSPTSSSFKAVFRDFSISESLWKKRAA